MKSADDAQEVFERLHAEREDPWSLYSSEFEVRKRATLIAMLSPEGASQGTGPSVPLPQFDRALLPRFGRALEIGCSVGALSGSLAQICTEVVAIDASSTAIATARERQRDRSTIEFHCMTIPAQWPEYRGEDTFDPFDLVVISETGYYLTEEQLLGTLDRIRDSISAAGTLALCHWRGEIEGWPLDAARVHAICLDYFQNRHPDSRPVIDSHEDPDFLIDIIHLDPCGDLRGHREALQAEARAGGGEPPEHRG